MNNVTMEKNVDWESMDQGLSKEDRMFCQMLIYCLKDEVRKKAVSEQKSQEGQKINKQEEKIS